ncbi:Unannotated, partial [Lentimonas sp. CC10]
MYDTSVPFRKTPQANILTRIMICEIEA